MTALQTLATDHPAFKADGTKKRIFRTFTIPAKCNRVELATLLRDAASMVAVSGLDPDKRVVLDRHVTANSEQPPRYTVMVWELDERGIRGVPHRETESALDAVHYACGELRCHPHGFSFL